MIFDHEDNLDMTNVTHLELSAPGPPLQPRHQPVRDDERRLWDGLYLNNDRVAFSSNTVLLGTPVSNGTVEVDEWSFIQVMVVVGQGYSFFINGVDAGTVIDADAAVPLGDFGSNDCYENERSWVTSCTSAAWVLVAIAITLRVSSTTSRCMRQQRQRCANGAPKP